MKPIKDLFLFLWEDFMIDLHTIKVIIGRARRGEDLIQKERMEEIKEEFRQFGKDLKSIKDPHFVYTWLKKNWINIILLLVVGIIGYRWGLNHMAHYCNDFILENYVENKVTETATNFSNYLANYTLS